MLDQQVEALIRGPQYAMPQGEKDALLAPILMGLCRSVADRCPSYRRFLDRMGGNAGGWHTLADIPPLPAAMFKHFLLSAVPPEQIVRELHSSATSGQKPSRIVVDKTTAFRQSRALVSILKEHIGNKRRAFLVLDAADAVAEGSSLTARARPFAAWAISPRRPPLRWIVALPAAWPPVGTASGTSLPDTAANRFCCSVSLLSYGPSLS